MNENTYILNTLQKWIQAKGRDGLYKHSFLTKGKQWIALLRAPSPSCSNEFLHISLANFFRIHEMAYRFLSTFILTSKTLFETMLPLCMAILRKHDHAYNRRNSSDYINRFSDIVLLLHLFDEFSTALQSYLSFLYDPQIECQYLTTLTNTITRKFWVVFLSVSTSKLECEPLQTPVERQGQGY